MSGAPRPDGDDGRSHYRAGVQGGKAIYDRLEALADARALRGWSAQVRYLTGRESGRAALARADVPASALQRWLIGPEGPGGSAPNAANQSRLQRIYTQVHRDNMRSWLKGQLNNHGKGTVVEVTPAEDVDAQSGHQMPVIEFELDDWDKYVDAWADDDLDAMYDYWDDDADDLYGGDGAYAYVSSIGF